jgi:hypothetical protein
MSSIYSAASEDLALASNEPECEPSRSASSAPSKGLSSENTGLKSKSTKIFEIYQRNISPQMEFPSMPSAEVSLAKTLATPERAPGSPGSAADSGPITLDLLANFDLVSSSWRTSQLCLLEGLTLFSETWPRSGMTQNGTAFLLPTLAPGINGTESGYLPTPRASARGAPLDRYYGSTTYRSNLEEALRNGPDDPTYQSPDFVEMMMGFPENWTVVMPSATPSSRKSRKSSDGQS